MTDTKKRPPTLRLIKTEKPNEQKPKQPESNLGKEMNDFCNQLQRQIDAILKS